MLGLVVSRWRELVYYCCMIPTLSAAIPATRSVATRTGVTVSEPVIRETSSTGRHAMTWTCAQLRMSVGAAVVRSIPTPAGMEYCRRAVARNVTMAT